MAATEKAASEEEAEVHKHPHRLHDGDEEEGEEETWCAFIIRVLVIGLLAWVFALIYVTFLMSLLSAALVSRFSIDPNNWQRDMNGGMWGKGILCFVVLAVLPGAWVGSGVYPLPLERNANPWISVWLLLIFIVQMATLKYVWQRPTLCTLGTAPPPPLAPPTAAPPAFPTATVLPPISKPPPRSDSPAEQGRSRSVSDAGMMPSFGGLVRRPSSAAEEPPLPQPQAPRGAGGDPWGGATPCHWRNLITVGTYLLEPFQFTSLLLLSTGGTLGSFVSSNGQLSWLQSLSVVGADLLSPLQRFSVSIAVVLVYMYMCGLFIALELAPEHPLGPLLFQFISGALYVTVTSSLFSLLSVTESSALHLLTAEALVFYTCTSVFVSIYRGDAGVRRDAIRTLPLFLGLERVFKGILAVIAVFAVGVPIARAGILLVLFVVYGAATAIMRPCSAPILNALRMGSAGVGAWAAGTVLVGEVSGSPPGVLLWALFPCAAILLTAIAVGVVAPQRAQASTANFSRPSLLGEAPLLWCLASDAAAVAPATPPPARLDDSTGGAVEV